MYDNLDTARFKWEFPYLAAELAVAAQTQKKFREDRVAFWKQKYEEVLKEIRESGVEVTESIATELRRQSDYRLSNTRATMNNGPRVSIRSDLAEKLHEAHERIEHHQEKVFEYDGWIQVLTARGNQELKLLHKDWLYFFGRDQTPTNPDN